MWIVFALLSAIFAALTSILAKIGIEGVDSNLATAIRTVVVVGMAWIMVFITYAFDEMTRGYGNDANRDKNAGKYLRKVFEIAKNL